MNKPVVLVVMDGIGISENGFGNAVKAANTPILDFLMENHSNIAINAHGVAVGLPSDDDMGNSEVGHNALGSGQIYSQGAKLVNASIESGELFKSETWNMLIDNTLKNNSTLHFLGLLSDGNVHSNIAHLKAMISKSKENKVKKVRIHILLDGRDVPATSALMFVTDLEQHLATVSDETFDAKIASGGGRMQITMDRYEADWNMVKRGWDTHVLGKGRLFNNATDAIETLRTEFDVIDQDLPPFVIGENEKPIGKILDKDSVIFFNFRGDRSIEISRAFDEKAFTYFDRELFPDVVFAGMLQYDGDLQIPHHFLVNPPSIKNTLSELLTKEKIKQFAISETQKFGHVTYFWNGNRSEKLSDELEIFHEVASDNIPFNQRPWMKSAEITDETIKAIESKQYGFIRLNYPNGDMVGHTGDYNSTIISVEAVDLALKRLMKACDDFGAILIITSDHGNADEMYEKSTEGTLPKPKTAHTLNPVPFIIYDKDLKHNLKTGNFGLANVAATIVTLLGLEKPVEWEESIL